MELRALFPRREYNLHTKVSTRANRRKALVFQPAAVRNWHYEDIAKNVDLLDTADPSFSIQQCWQQPENSVEADSPLGFKVDLATITPNLYGICEERAETQHTEDRSLFQLIRRPLPRKLDFKQLRRPNKLLQSLLPRHPNRKRGLSVSGRPLTPARLGRTFKTQPARVKSQLRSTSNQWTLV